MSQKYYCWFTDEKGQDVLGSDGVFRIDGRLSRDSMLEVIQLTYAQ